MNMDQKMHNLICRPVVMLFLLVLSAAWFGIPVMTFAQTPADLLIIRGQGAAFDEAEKGIVEECGGDFTLYDMFIGDSTSAADIAGAMDTRKPAIVVLMDNRAISLYKEYQKNLRDSARVIPSVAIMGVLIEQVMKGLKNAHGISYEVPVVTAAIGLRSVLGKPVVRIGIPHREMMSDYLKKSAGYCKMEKFEITPCLIAGKSSRYKDELQKGLQSLLKDKKVDALFIPNDNILLRPDLIRGVWLPFVKSYRVPVIVGVEVLASPRINLGTFAIIPDHFALGKQAAAALFDARDNNWQFGETRVDPPVSVYKIINGPQARDRFRLGKEAFGSIDKVLE